MPLMIRWLAGDLDERDGEVYEQHLLFCPPCLIQKDKARIALAALPTAATVSAPERLVDELTGLV